jgi:hypothetical protein
LAWELITTILEPKILAPYLAAHANIPTQISIGEGNYSTSASATIPYYNQLVSMIGNQRFGRGIYDSERLLPSISQSKDNTISDEINHIPRAASRIMHIRYGSRRKKLGHRISHTTLLLHWVGSPL